MKQVKSGSLANSRFWLTTGLIVGIVLTLTICAFAMVNQRLSYKQYCIDTITYFTEGDNWYRGDYEVAHEDLLRACNFVQ